MSKYTILTLAFAFVALPVLAQETVQFGCDAQPSQTCYFSIRYANDVGNRNFTLRGGERDYISGVTPGSDVYLVSIDQSPPNDPSDCGKNYWCKKATIIRGYNN